MMRNRPTRPRKGFTLLELMAITVVIGILATLAITKMGQTKQRTLISVMQTDLRNLATAAESYFINGNTYEGFPLPNSSNGVTLTFTPQAGGFVATAVHEGVPGIVCSIDTGEGGSSQPECR